MESFAEITTTEQARQAVASAKVILSRLEAKEKALKLQLKRELVVGNMVPCKALILSDGSVAVHVLNSLDNSVSTLHIVELEEGKETN